MPSELHRFALAAGAALGLLAAAPLAAAESPPSPPPRPDATFHPWRPTLLGLAIERRSRPDDEYRVVERRTGRDPVELGRGPRERCEELRLAELERRHGHGNLNIRFPTLGGRQFWTDRCVYAGWRVQENYFTGHCRLLDTEDERRAWGSWEACRVALEAERVRHHLAPRSRRLVLLLHGLFRSRHSMDGLKEALQAQGWQVAAVSYPSTRRGVRGHADRVIEVLDQAEGVEEVSFVTHSLGGLVVRAVLAREARWKERIAVGRLVMLGPPNRGSRIAEALHDWRLYRLVAGPAGQDITPSTVASLPPPSCPFGIVAGGTGTERGFNPLLPGDDDGTVRVEATKLPGARDFLRVRCRHSCLPGNPEVVRATVRFLAFGRFRPRLERSERATSDATSGAPAPRAATP